MFQISWIRHGDIHLLTVGRYTYTSDQRFSAHHIPLTHFWQLRIRAVTPRDEGFYECQVSTTPPRGHRIELRVVGEMRERGLKLCTDKDINICNKLTTDYLGSTPL